jgi:predicted house-cleaning noncanonical NTP pyrophosphatase (MazG superfamily)
MIPQEKLIRDFIPRMAMAEGRQLALRTADSRELGPLLSRKLVEEALEVAEALATGDRAALVEELGDLQTVLEALAKKEGIGLDEVLEAAHRKRLSRGGFDAGLVLAQADPHGRRLHVGGSASLVDALRHELQHCKAAGIAVAFVMRSGLDLMEGALRSALLRGARLQSSGPELPSEGLLV